jgi:hypothetical protein
MAPPVAGTARRAPTRSAPSTLPSGSPRPPLRVFEPAPRRRSTRAVRGTTMWVAGLLVVGSLLAVVVGDALITEGQIRLSKTQRQVAATIATQKSLQVAVAEKAAPPVVVKQAKSEGLVAPSQVVYLPRVRLDVPLPVPHTTPAPPPAATTHAASAPSAASPGGSSTTRSGGPAGSTATTAPAQR